MEDVLIIKNIGREGPGLLADILSEHNLGSRVVDLDAGEAFPDPTGYKAVVVLGGPDSANDTTPKMLSELAQIKKVLAQRIPYLGICLGMQALVKAAGGKIVPAPVKEVGFMDATGEPCFIDIAPETAGDPLFAELPASLRVFHLHGETVELTDAMQLLGTGKHCRNQIVKVADNAYGIQSHFELTPEMLAGWAQHDPDLQPIGLETLQTQFADVQATYTTIGRTLFTNFLHVAGLIAG